MDHNVTFEKKPVILEDERSFQLEGIYTRKPMGRRKTVFGGSTFGGQARRPGLPRARTGLMDLLV